MIDKLNNENYGDELCEHVPILIVSELRSVHHDQETCEMCVQISQFFFIIEVCPMR